MDEWQVEALGTVWRVTVDGDTFTPDVMSDMEDTVASFEAQFSRFKHDSEVNSFRAAAPGQYEVSNRLAALLTVAAQLREVTDGRFDPTVATLLERAGYDSAYSFVPHEEDDQVDTATWELTGTTLTLSGPAVFDLGGIGKGYAIDLIAALLQQHGYSHFIVDAGGDMYGTTKADGTSWRVAIAQPGKPSRAVGMTELNHQALAVSDTFGRRWGNWHHLVDAKEGAPVADRIGAVAVAPTAFFADAMTSALFFSDNDRYHIAAQVFQAHYLLIFADTAVVKSRGWLGELYEA